MNDFPLLAIYLLPMLLIWFIYMGIKFWRQAAALKKLQAAKESGLTQPASLHPVINPSLCLGCGACVKACPEGEILGLVGGKAALVEPSHCIGHGACQQACPFNAITLVFGSAERGVDIPTVSSTFETSLAGVYIAGELGGMGLIRNAVTQGVEAIAAIASSLKKNPVKGTDYDVIIVGSGPAGIAASLAAQEQGLRSLVLEQDTLGGTVAHFPRNKIVMTAPVILPLVGKVSMREISKESLLAFWQDVVTKHKPKIHFNERLTHLTPLAEGFKVDSSSNNYTAAKVLLCLGRRGTPRTLDVEGEQLPKVVYSLIDPEQYQGQSILVVGGGDSALEAAASLAQQPDTHVWLSYRSAAFSRAKPKNRQWVDTLSTEGRLTVWLQSTVEQITTDTVVLNYQNKRQRINNDAVIVCAGGVLPTPFLQSIGIAVETKFGVA